MWFPNIVSLRLFPSQFAGENNHDNLATWEVFVSLIHYESVSEALGS